MTAVARSRPIVSPSRIAWRRRFSMLQDALLLVMTAIFFYAHTRHVVVDHVFTSVPYAVEQGLLVGIILTRRRSYTTSTRVMDWVWATLGGWLPLTVQIAGDTPATLGVAGSALQVVGLSFAIVGFLYLGRSFGVVAANRGLKINGPYRIVRHPIYFAHNVTLAGFLLANPLPINVAIAATIVTAHLMRIQAEERILSATSDYEAYAAKVRWRLIPGIY